MKEKTRSIKIGDAIEVKGKIYLVFDVRNSYLFCRRYRFSKAGRFQYYQDYSFACNDCKLANPRDTRIINEQRIQASLQRKPYSPIADNYVEHLIR